MRSLRDLRCLAPGGVFFGLFDAELGPSSGYNLMSRHSPDAGGGSRGDAPDGAPPRVVPAPLARRASRLRPQMRLGELLEAWRAAREPSPKTLDGALRAVAQFQDLFGDLTVSQIVADDLFDYRDSVAILPRNL